MQAQEFLSLERSAGYGSILGDGNLVSLELCQQCQQDVLGPWLRVQSQEVPPTMDAALEGFDPARHGGEFRDGTGSEDSSSFIPQADDVASDWAPGLPDRPGPETFMCGPGWRPLIEQTFDALEARQAITGGATYRVVEVKEKFWDLRIYLRPVLRDPALDLTQPPNQVERLLRYQAMVSERRIQAAQEAQAQAQARGKARRQAQARKGGGPYLLIRPDVRPRRWLITELDRRSERVQRWITDTLRLPTYRMVQLLAEHVGEEDERPKWPYLWTVTEFGIPEEGSSEWQATAKSWVCELPWLYDDRLQAITGYATTLSTTLCDRCGAQVSLRTQGKWGARRCELHANTPASAPP